MEIQKERYSITELAEMLQVTDHALRFYEKECELNVPKDERGRRYYTTELANIMYKIKLMRSEGLEIKAIKKILQEENVFGPPVVIPESSTASIVPSAAGEYEAMQTMFTEFGKQLTREISYELDITREHLMREISKSKLELGACVDHNFRRLESKMDKHYEEVDKALARWREKKRKRPVKNLFLKIFGSKA
jgi:DNA-binding transcriptional MerR regulator